MPRAPYDFCIVVAQRTPTSISFLSLPSTMIHPVARKPKRVLAKFVVSAVLLLNLNANLMERSSILSEHRSLTRALENGGCSIEPVSEFKTPDANATRTLLTSYPGSGKRFAWLIMSALTNYDVADDWDFSGNLNENVLTLKTSKCSPSNYIFCSLSSLTERCVFS